MEDSVETSIAVFFGLQGIPNALEDPQNPKVRYSEPQLRFFSTHGKVLFPTSHPFKETYISLLISFVAYAYCAYKYNEIADR